MVKYIPMVTTCMWKYNKCNLQDNIINTNFKLVKYFSIMSISVWKPNKYNLKNKNKNNYNLNNKYKLQLDWISLYGVNMLVRKENYITMYLIKYYTTN